VDESGGDGAGPQEEGASRRCTEAGGATTAQKGQEPGEPTSSEAEDGGAGDSKGGGSLPSPPRETAKQRTATEEAVAEEINIADRSATTGQPTRRKARPVASDWFDGWGAADREPSTVATMGVMAARRTHPPPRGTAAVPTTTTTTTTTTTIALARQQGGGGGNSHQGAGRGPAAVGAAAAAATGTITQPPPSEGTGNTKPLNWESMSKNQKKKWRLKRFNNQGNSHQEEGSSSSPAAAGAAAVGAAAAGAAAAAATGTRTQPPPTIRTRPSLPDNWDSMTKSHRRNWKRNHH